jgi:hypothetical protein
MNQLSAFHDTQGTLETKASGFFWVKLHNVCAINNVGLLKSHFLFASHVFMDFESCRLLSR